MRFSQVSVAFWYTLAGDHLLIKTTLRLSELTEQQCATGISLVFDRITSSCRSSTRSRMKGEPSGYDNLSRIYNGLPRIENYDL
jgi:hypothetical protein